MTQPPPGRMPSARARAVTDKLISTVLTVMVGELQAGADRDGVTDLAGVELTDTRVDVDRMRLLAACALSRLAVLHHDIEQLADTWQHAGRDLLNTGPAATESARAEQRAEVATQSLCAAELRKLVDP